LDPEVAVNGLILLENERISFANLQYLLVVFLLDVEVQELLLQVVALAAVLDALL